MMRPTPEYYELASQLLEREARGHQEPAELADVAERVCRKLYKELAGKLGPEEFSVLVARSLRLAKEEYQFFQRVEFESHSEACLEGLHESAQAIEPAELRQAIVTLYATFIWLLATFISERLVLRHMVRIWPGVSFGRAGENSQEVKQ